MIYIVSDKLLRTISSEKYYIGISYHTRYALINDVRLYKQEYARGHDHLIKCCDISGELIYT